MGTKSNDLDLITVYLDEIGRFKKLTEDEEKDLISRLEQGEEKAKEEIFNRNLKLAYKMAKHYAGRAIPLEDLIQEANIGLLKAAEHYSAEKGKFSTYAAIWIKKYIREAYRDQTHVLSFSKSFAQKLYNVSRKREELSKKLGYEPDEEELSFELGIPAEEIRDILIFLKAPVSFDEPVSGEEDELYLRDIVSGTDLNAEYFGPTKDTGRYRKLDTALKILSERERDVIKLYYGLDLRNAQSCHVIGEHLGVSPGRVSEMHRNAILKLQRWYKVA